MLGKVLEIPVFPGINPSAMGCLLSELLPVKTEHSHEAEREVSPYSPSIAISKCREGSPVY